MAKVVAIAGLYRGPLSMAGLNHGPGRGWYHGPGRGWYHGPGRGWYHGPLSMASLGVRLTERVQLGHAKLPSPVGIASGTVAAVRRYLKRPFQQP